MAVSAPNQVSQLTEIPGPDNGLTKSRVKKHWGRWLVLVLVLLIAILLVAFLFALSAEISRRDNELKGVIDRAQKGTSASIITSKLLTGLVDNLASSSPATTTVNLNEVAVQTSPKDSMRQLAEKLDRPQLGNASSSLVIVEFADFNCPVCEAEFPIIRTITNKYAKDLLFIFRNYPVINDNSAVLAQASLCANEQGKFWAFHDRLYFSQGKIATNDDFKNLAIMSGLDWTKLQACLNSQKYTKQILDDTSDALDLGVKGTPTFFVNGHKLEGAVTTEVWEQIIAKYKELNKNNL